ncbi:MAG: radical SAM family heme chaperone HemW [Endozoicomonas sp.]
MLTLPPLSLYIHVPWCVKKCPYCDFNSHRLHDDIPEDAYINALLSDLQKDLSLVQNRDIHTIFIGGGTPSLLSGKAYQRLLNSLQQYVSFSDNIEITMEMNPGTYEHDRVQSYIDAGVNRISLGVQSFQDEKLQKLGRIHCASEAYQAIKSIVESGFSNINIDLMHGLPNQSLDDALYDLQQAIDLVPAHISWYQLTIEPNTIFYSKKPVLPPDDMLWDIQKAGQMLLASAGFKQYEISAYSHSEKRSRHNINYWQFGDYIGIGAGAHGKLTDLPAGKIIRNWKTRMPADYLSANGEMKPFEASRRVLGVEDLSIEFMMNVLRLNHGVYLELYSKRTGKNIGEIQKQLTLAQQKGLLEPLDSGRLQPTPTGRLFLNDLLEIFT